MWRACVPMAVEHYEARRNIEGFRLENGRTVFLLAEGRLVNLAAGDGHPVEIMDMSFALQALCALRLAQKGREMPPALYDVPRGHRRRSGASQADRAGRED